MVDPKKKRYVYMMLAGFGAISMSIILFFILGSEFFINYRLIFRKKTGKEVNRWKTRNRNITGLNPY